MSETASRAEMEKSVKDLLAKVADLGKERSVLRRDLEAKSNALNKTGQALDKAKASLKHSTGQEQKLRELTSKLQSERDVAVRDLKAIEAGYGAKLDKASRERQRAVDRAHEYETAATRQLKKERTKADYDDVRAKLDASNVETNRLRREIEQAGIAHNAYRDTAELKLANRQEQIDELTKRIKPLVQMAKEKVQIAMATEQGKKQAKAKAEAQGNAGA